MKQICICTNCGAEYQVSTFKWTNPNLCKDCFQKRDVIFAKNAKRRQSLKKDILKVIVTTTNNIEGYEVIEYLGIESIEYVIGTGPFSEFTTGIEDLFGQRSSAFQNKLKTAKKECFEALKFIAADKGANAVIGIDLDYTEFSGNRVALIVNGTLVKIVKRGRNLIQQQEKLIHNE